MYWFLPEFAPVSELLEQCFSNMVHVTPASEGATRNWNKSACSGRHSTQWIRTMEWRLKCAGFDRLLLTLLHTDLQACCTGPWSACERAWSYPQPEPHLSCYVHRCAALQVITFLHPEYRNQIKPKQNTASHRKSKLQILYLVQWLQTARNWIVNALPLACSAVSATSYCNHLQLWESLKH